MEQLTGLDATFLRCETGTSPMHIGPLYIYDVSSAPGGFVRFKDIVRTFEERLDCSTVFRRKLAQVPLSLDNPYWVEDNSFNLEYHVRHISLPKPGDWRQLCIQVARLHSRPLDRSRPPWEVYVIEGLDNVEGFSKGSFALFFKIHHSAIDGATGNEIMGAIHDLSPEQGQQRLADVQPWCPEPMPGTGKLLWRAYLSKLRHPFRLASAASKSIPALRRVRQARKEEKFRYLGEKEKTRFNGEISAHRVFGGVVYKLAEVHRIKTAVEGATVNDVMLTVVGGAMKQYLGVKNETPEKSLVAGAPVNVRSEDEAGSGGNMVSMMSVSLCTDIHDPLERLQALHQGAVESKAYLNAMGARTMTDICNSLPSLFTGLAFRVASAAGILARGNPIFNTVITNVPGPQVPLYMAGAKVVLCMGAGPCMDNLGIFHPVSSYNGMIAVSFQACREMLPDPEFYEQCLRQSFAELQAAVPAKGKKSG